MSDKNDMDTLVLVINAVGILNGVVDANMEYVADEGFIVADQRRMLLTQEQVDTLSVPESEREKFLAGPVMVFVIRKKDGYDSMTRVFPLLEDAYYSFTPYIALRDFKTLLADKSVTPVLERTLVVIKPGTPMSMVSQIQDLILQNDFNELGTKMIPLSSQQIKQLFADPKEAIEYTKGDCTCICVEKLGAIDDMVLLIGPSDNKEAKQYAPNTIRAKFATEQFKNPVYCSTSAMKAHKDVLAMFPTPFPLERTLALLKPDIVKSDQVHIIHDLVVKQHGFTVIAQERFFLSKHRCEEILASLAGDPTFEDRVRYLSSGPVVAWVLAKPGAINAWNLLCGPVDPEHAKKVKPNSLRAKYGKDLVYNSFDASRDPEEASQQIDLYFPYLATEAIPVLKDVEDIVSFKPKFRQGMPAPKSLKDVLSEGLTQLCRVKPTGRAAITWLAEWMLRNNPNKPTAKEPEEKVLERQVKVDVELPSRAIAERTVLNEGVVVSKKLEQQTSQTFVWCVRGPGVCDDGTVKQLAEKYRLDLINVPALHTAAVTQRTDFGRVIASCNKTMRPVPPHVTVGLIKQAIANHPKQKRFLISQFPLTLDDAFAFEEMIGAPETVMNLEAPEEKCVAKMWAEQEADLESDKKLDRNEFVAAIRSFREDILYITEHYSLFNKTCNVNADMTPDNLINKELKDVLGVKPEKEEKKPEKPPKLPKMPIKKKKEEDE